MRYLRKFGEIGIITDHANKKARGKLKDRGFPAIMVGLWTRRRVRFLGGTNGLQLLLLKLLLLLLL